MSQTAMVNGKNNRNTKSQHLTINGAADQWDFREDDDNYFEQPGKLFNLMSTEQQQVLFENTARNMNGVEKHIQLRHIITLLQSRSCLRTRCSRSNEYSMGQCRSCYGLIV